MERPGKVLRAVGTEVFEECVRRTNDEGLSDWKRAKSEHVLSDQSWIQACISERGFSPIAVLPRRLWVELCMRFGLYRFENIVPLYGTSVFAPAHMEDTASKLMQERKRISINVLLYGFNFLTFAAFATLILAVCGAYSMAIGLFVSAILCVPIGYILSKAFACREVNSPEKICSLLWPDGYDEGQQTIKVNFVGMPTAFQEAMDRLFLDQRLSPCIVAAPRAIDVDQYDIGLILSRLWHSECPVLYVRMQTLHGEMVAILDQYGSFPVEQEVLAWLRDKGFGTF